jgi:hypothetical protein
VDMLSSYACRYKRVQTERKMEQRAEGNIMCFKRQSE